MYLPILYLRKYIIQTTFFERLFCVNYLPTFYFCTFPKYDYEYIFPLFPFQPWLRLLLN